MSMSTIDEDDVTFEDIATLCEESQDELADLLLQEGPFYSFIKNEQNSEFDATPDAQVPNFLHCSTGVTDLTDVSHEETCCSYDCLNSEARSPGSDGSMSPDNRKKCNNSRKNRTPNTLRHIMEKHRHSERIRHHTLNEQLKAICSLVPGSADDNRETKVVMMQRVISYIAFLENTIEFLCGCLGSKPHPSWVLLTTNFRDYFKDYFKGFEDTDIGDDEVLAATQNLSQSMQDEVSYGRFKVSSPTVDSTTDCVVPVMVLPVEKEVTVLSQDSDVHSSSVAGDDDHTAHMWSVFGDHQMTGTGHSHGDADMFFSSAVDDSVSAVLEITSSTQVDNDTLVIEFDTREQGNTTYTRMDKTKVHAQPVVPTLRPVQHFSVSSKPVHTYYTIEKHIPDHGFQSTVRRNKRKQLSPRRSSHHDDYLSERAYLPSWSCEPQKTMAVPSDDSKSDATPCKVRVVPYNIRCNHRHPVQRLQATRGKLSLDCPAPVQVSKPQEDTARVTATESQDKLSSKLDLRKTSWMNGFMMFSRLNRRKFIQAHPGVHTSHISKIMGHAWRNMNREEQAPYKDKAKLCAQELYRAYTSTPEFTLYSPVSAAAAAAAASATSAQSTITTTGATTTATTASLPDAESEMTN
ncbi:uncharacterized protein [Littorina saxatilis]|uniref:uncharacterized protein n=1 Tax=Littorina saxatilis TaxID=31220 RepID=UPI0038B669E2